MRVLVTRPEPAASRTAAALRRLGHEAIVSPLVETVEDATVAIDPGGFAAAVLTSAAAAEAVARRPDRDLILRLPAYVVGERTAAAARAAGFTTVVTGAGTAAALVERLAAAHAPSSAPVLYLAGRDRTGDLEAGLASRGIAVRIAEVYRAEAAGPLSAAAAAALRAGAVDAVLAFSRRSADLLVSRLTELRVHDGMRHVSAHAISRSAAEPLRALDFAAVVVAAEPSAEALLATLPAPRDGA